MPDYTGGFTSALNDQSMREERSARTAISREQLMEATRLFQQQQQEAARKLKAKQALGDLLPELADMFGGGPKEGPQSPPPGAASTPMLSPPPAGAMPAPPPQPGPPGAPMGAMPRPPGAPPAPMPSMPPPAAPQGAPMPQGAGPGAPPPGMAPPPAGAAPAGAPPAPWRGMPPMPGGMGGPSSGGSGGGMPGLTPPPSPSEPMRAKQVNVADMARLLAKRGIKGSMAMDMLEQWKPFMDAENKAQLEAMKTEMSAQKAAISAYQAVIRAQQAGERVETGRQNLAERVRHDRAMERGKSGGDASPAPAGDSVDYAAMAPTDPKYNHGKAVQQFADQQAAWRYNMTGVLPYRKGTGGGKDANERIKRVAAEEAMKFGYSPEEIATLPAAYKSDLQSMAFQTKKLDAIEGQLRSFHNNIDTFDSLAKGVAPKLGGERTKAMAKDLAKIDFVGVKSFDEMKLKVQQQFNDPTVAGYLVAAMAAAMDYARIMQGPQSIASLTEGARKDAERLISAGMDDKARQAVIGTLESDTEGQVKGIRDQMKTIQKRITPGAKAKDDGGTVREFKSEAEARAAGVKPGDRVKIGGTLGTWK